MPFIYVLEMTTPTGLFLKPSSCQIGGSTGIYALTNTREENILLNGDSLQSLQNNFPLKNIYSHNTG